MSPHVSSAAASLAPTSKLFKSFWMGGFESACHINAAGERLDMIASTQHDTQVEHDYALLSALGIQSIRDGVRWHLIDRAGGYDFSSLAPMVKAARRHGIQVIWTLCHYGWPDDVDVFSARFVDRFARFCTAVAQFLLENGEEFPFFLPVNEISFLTWAMGNEELFGTAAHGRSFELKSQLVRAAIAGCEAVWSVNERSRIVHGDPVIHVFPPRDRPDLAEAAQSYTESQYETWDMIAGRTHPELGGSAKHLDIVAAHLYHSNQWEISRERLRWEDEPRDERWIPFHKMLSSLYERYRRPVLLGETSHFGSGRVRWLREIVVEVARARGNGVPIEGVCLFPIIDRHDWDDVNHWHNSGMWDIVVDERGILQRVLNETYAAAFRQARFEDH